MAHDTQLYVDRAGLPPATVARFIRLAAFQTPEFYRAQAMRADVWQAEDHLLR